MEKLEFYKMVASGNDFIIIDNRSRSVPQRKLSELAKSFCRRKESVGADGLLVIENSNKANVKMRVFNPDGSEVGMCGNGARCVGLYVRSQGIKNGELNLEALGGFIDITFSEDKVRVKMPEPKDFRNKFTLKTLTGDFEVYYVEIGVPHVVMFSERVEDIDVVKIGREIRYHEVFAPSGTNVDFIQIIGDSEIKIRTYERGVEDETLACGTGASASAFISCKIGKVDLHGKGINVHTKSSKILKVYFLSEPDISKNICLEGDARVVYKGTMDFGKV